MTIAVAQSAHHGDTDDRLVAYLVSTRDVGQVRWEKHRRWAVPATRSNFEEWENQRLWGVRCADQDGAQHARVKSIPPSVVRHLLDDAVPRAQLHLTFVEDQPYAPSQVDQAVDGGGLMHPKPHDPLLPPPMSKLKGATQ